MDFGKMTKEEKEMLEDGDFDDFDNNSDVEFTSELKEVI